MKPRRPKTAATGEIFKLVDVLPALSQELRLEDKAREFSLLTVCDQFLARLDGGRLAGKAQALKVHRQGNRRQLLIRVDNGAVATELSFHLLQLKDQINAFAPQTGFSVDELTICIRQPE